MMPFAYQCCERQESTLELRAGTFGRSWADDLGEGAEAAITGAVLHQTAWAPG